MYKLLAETLGLIFSDDDPVWCDAREVLITGGIRAGKSTRNAFKGLCKVLDPACRLIWIIGPDYVLAQQEFSYLLEWCMKLGLVAKPYEKTISSPQEGSRRMLLVTGCLVETKSAKHAERLASVAPDLIILSEPGQMTSEIYATCIGRLAEKRGQLFMGGTLEDDVRKPRWRWYEDLAVEWMNNPPGSNERAFSIPTWSNKAIYPLGEADPYLVMAREKVGDYRYARMYGGRPEGVENPCFPLMWEAGAMDEFFTLPEEDVVFRGGAIGVDYGRTWEHPSAVVAISEDQYGRYWVREGWKGYKVPTETIEDIVDSFKENYRIWQGAVDPNQGVLGDILGFEIAAGGSSGGRPTHNRISMTNALLENRALYFDASGPLVQDVWASMRSVQWIANNRGEIRYERPLDDDLAQCVMYAVECLRGGGSYLEIPSPDLGRVSLGTRPTFSSGSAGRI